MEEAVVIGVVVRAHGIHGQVRARATGPTLPGLRLGERIGVTDRDGHARELELTARTDAGDGLLLQFAGVGTRSDADALRGATLSVDASRLPAGHDPDEFYVRDLVGATVWMGEACLGTVRDVINRPANDVLDVVDADGAGVLLPFTRDAVLGIDPGARRIEMRPGLLDVATGGPDAD